MRIFGTSLESRSGKRVTPQFPLSRTISPRDYPYEDLEVDPHHLYSVPVLFCLIHTNSCSIPVEDTHPS